MLAMLEVGQLWYRRGTETTFVSVAFGIAEILPDRVTVLCENAERADEIDVARAEAARSRLASSHACSRSRRERATASPPRKRRAARTIVAASRSAASADTPTAIQTVISQVGKAPLPHRPQQRGSLL
jgi:F-type H+-transporting ATPase subunit epsilon